MLHSSPTLRFLQGRNRTEHSILIAVLTCAVLAGCHKATAPAKDLNWAVGTWHGARRAADDGKDLPMTVRVERLGGGQIERLQVETSPKPYVGFTVRSQDPDGKWTMTYANSTRQNIGRLNGKLDGKQSTWESMNTDTSHGSRFVSEQIDSNHWRRTQFVSENGGKTWSTLFTDELERDAQ